MATLYFCFYIYKIICKRTNIRQTDLILHAAHSKNYDDSTILKAHLCVFNFMFQKKPFPVCHWKWATSFLFLRMISYKYSSCKVFLQCVSFCGSLDGLQCLLCNCRKGTDVLQTCGAISHSSSVQQRLQMNYSFRNNWMVK